MLKALVVDDEYLVRTGIRETIDWPAYGVEIVGEADNGEDGLELALRHRPDVILTDIRMPFMNGLEFIERIKENRLEAGIIVLSGYDEFQYAQAALKLGASSYLLKPVDTAELAASVRKLGLQVREQARERAHYGELKNELPQVASKFWLDLLHGRLREEEDISRRSALLPRIGQTSLAAVVVRRKERSAAASVTASDAASTPAPELGERHLTPLLEAHSVRAEALVPSGPDEWTVVAAAGGDPAAWLARLRAFGYGIVGLSAENGLPKLAVGIGKPADRLAQLHYSYGDAQEAAFKAASSLGGVWYAEDEAETATRREIRGALAYIREHYASNITVEMVASEVFVSPTHLMHLFRKELNKTFYECLTERRIEEAKRMLRDPKYRVYEVSDRVGFGDSKYFSQIFKKLTGMTPSEYAKREG
ncbi:response regulator transcription factor [Cohnella fermenti]|uniref:Response regulator n=1 Tax=Cohnella fermenti TaxID=2565925 RepID=A0A4S4BGZ1_9BACL|nr:response regulator [Cohnella fermenti]THF73750.1 response regulator [Cohnella fermenti]